MFNTSASHLLHLPAELRLQIFSHLIHIAPASSIPNRTAALERGFSSGVGHLTLLQDSASTWRSITIAKPPGFCLLAPAILRVSRQMYREVMDVLYSGILWVINIQTLRPITPPFVPSVNATYKHTSAIVASPNSKSLFWEWIRHVHIRQHIRPEENLIPKAQALKSLLGCLGTGVKSLQVTFHFDSMHLINDPEYPRTRKLTYNWMLYENALQGMVLGVEPQFRVGHYWLECEGQERFEQLAASVGGKVNSDDYIYW